MKLSNTLVALKGTIASIIVSAILLFGQFQAVGQTTSASGNWNTGGNWTGGVPANTGNATVNHAMTINKNITPTTGDYIINQPLTDLPGGTAYNLTIGSGTAGNQGLFDLRANAIFEGTLTVNGRATLIIRSGDTLTVGATSFANNSTVTIEAGGTLIVNGDFQNNNNSTGITINGSIIVNGNVTVGNGSTVVGSGIVTSTGSMTGAGTIFGSSPNCTTGPCGSSTPCATNTIAATQSICSGATPSTLTGASSGTGYTYQWQSSTTSSTLGFSDISGAASLNYSPGSLTTTTWYRRVAVKAACTVYSAALQITVTPTVAQPAAFTTSTTTICPGQSNVTYTVPVVSGATSYIWSYDGTGATITGSTNSVTISFSNIATSGALSVAATNACGPGTARILGITVGNISQIPTSGLIAHYKLDGNANDFINNNAGTLQNAPTSTTDRFGIASKAYLFNGTNQHISTNNTYNSPNDFTLSLWINTTTTAGGKLIGLGNSQTGQSGNYDRHIYMNNAGQIYFGVYPGAVRTINSSTSYNDGVWHLVTASLSSTNGMKLYIDGALIASDPTVLNGQPYTGYWKVGFDNIGGWTSQPSSNYFNGKIDEVLIYNTELTAGQISTIFSSPAGASSNSPVCNGGTLNLTAVTISGATYAWTGPNGFTSSAQNPSVANMSSAKEGTYTLTVTVGSCNQTAYAIGTISETLGPNISLIPTSGLLHQYKLNANASDAMGTNPGNFQNAPSTATDRFGITNKAYAFNGSTQYMSTNLSYNNPNNFTISIWFKTTTTSGGKLIGFGTNQTGQSGNYDRHIVMNDAGQIHFGVYPGALRILSTTTSYNDGNWHMATASLSSTNGTSLYLDGILIASDPSTTSAENYTGYWRIGYDNMNAWGITASSFYFNGSLDDVLIYNRAVTGSEVTTLYTSTGGAGNNGPVCIGSTLNLSSRTIGGATYSWTGPNSFSSSSQNPSFSFATAATGTYTVNVNQGGCTSIGYTNVFSSTAAGQWTGFTNTNWNTATNWCNGAVPTSSTDVAIPASVSNMPANAGTANVKNLTIAPSAILTNSSTGTMNIYGNFTGSGAPSYVDDGFTAFVGSTPQTITNVDTLHSVIINNTAGVTTTTPTYVEGHLTLTAGTLTSGGNLTVDLNKGAITGAGTGSISGNITVLKWVWNDGWHYISSPLSGRTAADWNDDVTIKFGIYSNLYSYDETIVDTLQEVGWTPLTTIATPIQDMTGYALYFKRSVYKTTLDLTGAYDHAQTYSSGSLTNTESAKPEADGWHLMGNPYPCVIDWSAASGWTKTGLDGAVYVWDGRNSRFATFVGGIGTNGGSRYIPAMQGFYVKVSTPGGTGSLSMNNNVRTTASNPDVWRVASEEKRIHLTATNGTYNDETYIRFTDEASTSFDTGYDAYKLANTGNTPSISTKLGKDKYAINSLPNTLENAIIPVPLNVGVSGAYAIKADVSNFEMYDFVILEDRLLNTFQDLKTTNEYTASLTKGDTTTRFFLHYKKEAKESVVTNTSNATQNNGINIYAYKQNITINFNEASVSNVDVMVFDAIGNQIHRIENANTTSGKIEFSIANANTGIYIIKVQSATGVTTQQVYISR